MEAAQKLNPEIKIAHQGRCKVDVPRGRFVAANGEIIGVTALDEATATKKIIHFAARVALPKVPAWPAAVIAVTDPSYQHLRQRRMSNLEVFCNGMRIVKIFFRERVLGRAVKGAARREPGARQMPTAALVGDPSIRVRVI